MLAIGIVYEFWIAGNTVGNYASVTSLEFETQLTSSGRENIEHYTDSDAWVPYGDQSYCCCDKHQDTERLEETHRFWSKVCE